jgi:hypothetical protein
MAHVRRFPRITDTMDLRFLSWDGPATRSLRALVDARLRAQQQLESDRRVGAGQLVG